MGAGCRYTHKNGSLAYWLDVPKDTDDDEPNEFYWEWFIEEVKCELEELGYFCESQYAFSNGLYNLRLETTYHGDGLLIYIDEKGEDGYDYADTRINNLARANFDRAECKIIRTLNKRWAVCVASSSYTANRIKPNTFLG
jgi:hypothetical protein